MRMVNVILIDPFNRTITEVEHDADDYRDIYRLIDADCFDCVHLDHGDAIFVDDEGLYREDQKFFYWKGFPDPLAGKGLIIGSDDDGNGVSAKIELDEVKARVLWDDDDIELKGFVDISGKVNHPILGPDTALIGHRAVFGQKIKGKSDE